MGAGSDVWGLGALQRPPRTASQDIRGYRERSRSRASLRSEHLCQPIHAAAATLARSRARGGSGILLVPQGVYRQTFCHQIQGPEEEETLGLQHI